MIREQEVEELASLARLALTKEEQIKLHHDLESILSYMSDLAEAGLEAPAKQDLGLVKNVMRDDGPAHPTGVYTDTLLAAAPRTKNGFVEVKKILDNTQS